MPILSNVPSKPSTVDSEKQKMTWLNMLNQANEHGDEFGVQSLPNLEGYRVTASKGPNDMVHVILHGDEGEPRGYLKMYHRGDHFQIASMMKNPDTTGPLHSGVLHHVSDHFQMPVVSDYKQTKGAMKYWNRVARSHGGVSLLKSGQQMPYNPDRMSPDSIWGQGEQHQDTLLAIHPRGIQS